MRDAIQEVLFWQTEYCKVHIPKNRSMMQPKILVIGATGKHGNTGAIVVDRLISQGRNVALLTPAPCVTRPLLSCKITARR
jgi:hypothetical protein